MSQTLNLSLRIRKRKNILRLLPAGGKPKWLEGGKVSAYAYEMCGHVTQTVDRYLELADKTKESLKRVATPCIDDHQIPPQELALKGELYGTLCCQNC